MRGWDVGGLADTDSLRRRNRLGYLRSTCRISDWLVSAVFQRASVALVAADLDETLRLGPGRIGECKQPMPVAWKTADCGTRVSTST